MRGVEERGRADCVPARLHSYFFSPLPSTPPPQQYLEFVGDSLLRVLGHPPAFGVPPNPFAWLEGIASKCALSCVGIEGAASHA